jgi:FMN-dependent oxidoreductase (nitrilotriacetate monooxygenase family)
MNFSSRAFAGPRRQMKLGLSLGSVGYHYAAWRHPDVPADGDMSFAHMARCARIAEEGLFDFIFLADVAAVRNLDDPRVAREREQGHVKLEPLTLLAGLAAVTSRVGLVATASTSFQDPFHLARKLASIDQISDGRAGWNLVTSTSPDEARNYGQSQTLDSATRHARARECLKVVNGLFDGWEPGAFPRDRASGVYMDRAKMHRLDHQGAHFRVRGPMDVDRPPQGRVPIISAGTSDNAQDLAAEVADLVYGGQPTLEGARAYYASVKGRLPRYGRSAESLRMMPGVMPCIGRTRQEAEDKFGMLQQRLHPLVGHGMLAINHFPDLRGHDIDAPMPPVTMSREHETAGREPEHTLALMERAQREKLTIRQVFDVISRGFWHFGMVGTPVEIADAMEEWFTTDAADGFIIQPPYTPGAAEDFVQMVMPELRRRGLFRNEYEGRTLRENLGLTTLA